MNIREIRRQNLAQLIKVHAEGSQRRFSELVGKPPSLISQMINDTRGMGEKVAREIESSLPIDKYSLDKEPSAPVAGVAETKAQYLTLRATVVINRLQKLAENKALTDEDFALIDQLVDRFQGEKSRKRR